MQFLMMVNQLKRVKGGEWDLELTRWEPGREV